jgi:hypothetical protein
MGVEFQLLFSTKVERDLVVEVASVPSPVELEGGVTRHHF